MDSCERSEAADHPTYVLIDGIGEFGHGTLQFADHWQEVRCDGLVGDYSYLCNHTDMNLFYTHWTCSGERVRVD